MTRLAPLFLLNSVMIFISGFFLVCGCSSGSGSNPIITIPDAFQSSPNGVNWDETLLGAYHLVLDTGNLVADLIPTRSASSFDTVEAIDITNFLLLEPCSNCVAIRSIGVDSDGNIRLSIGIKHPFPAGDPTQPITGRNRADLLVYNVEGVLVSDSVDNFNFPFTGVVVAKPFLLNADGYTSYLDSSIDEIFPTATNLHPYVLHFADYTDGNYDPVAYPQTGYPFPNPQTSPPTIPYGHLVMAQGSDYDFRDYIINPGAGGRIEFLYVVTGTYGVCATRNQRFTPECRIPQHQKKAASELDAYSDTNLKLFAGDPVSTTDLMVEVVDTNHGCQVGDSLTKVQYKSDVASICIELPDILNNPVVLNNPTPISGDGSSPGSPLLYKVSITNEKAASEGDYYGLLKVSDSYPTGMNNPDILKSKDAIKRAPPGKSPLEGLVDIAEFASYFVFNIEVFPTSICPESYRKEREEVISDNVNVVRGIDERCISVSGDNIYIAYKKTKGLCPWPPGYDLRDIRCLYSHDRGETFADSLVYGDYCESQMIDDGTICIASYENTVLILSALGAVTFVKSSYDGGISFTNNKDFNFGQNLIKRPAMSMNPSGDVFIAWINEYRPIPIIDYDYTIQCIIGDADLNFSSPKVVSDAIIFQGFSVGGGMDCDVASDSPNEAVIAWTDAGGAMEPLSGWIFYERFDGTPLVLDKKVSGSETGLNGRFPSVALETNDDVYVSWHVAGSPGRIYISHGTVAGDFASPEIVAQTDDPNYEVRPCLASVPTESPHVLFCNREPISGHEDVFLSWKCDGDTSYQIQRLNEPDYPSGIKRPIASMAILDDGELGVIWTSNENLLTDEDSLFFGFFVAQ